MRPGIEARKEPHPQHFAEMAIRTGTHTTQFKTHYKTIQQKSSVMPCHNHDF